MKKIAFIALALAAALQGASAETVDMLAYGRDNGEGGLRLAWRADSTQQWARIGQFVSSDFGPWGSYKKMFEPQLTHDANGWTATWIADREGNVLATAKSPDLRAWAPQTYVISTAPRTGVSHYEVDGKPAVGNVLKVDKQLVDDLLAHVAERNRLGALYDEKMVDDQERFAALSPSLSYKIAPKPQDGKKISDKLMGIFFEDINYAADGGLYAELVQNRDFEYAPADRSGDQNWNATTAWTFSGDGYAIKTDNPLHANNPHYLSVSAKDGFTFANEGYDGIVVKKGERYDLSFFARGKGKAVASIVDDKGNVLAKKEFNVKSGDWKQYEAALAPAAGCDKAKLEVTVKGSAALDFDMISLFPQNTFKGRKNGLRPDLAQTLADLKPRFIRFPGGCVAHGDGIDNIYDWKGSIGSLHERRPLRNLWGYHQTRGLGYYEFFQFCEDIGAEPLPVLAAGVPCQNSGTAAHHSHDAITTRGQQCGIPMEEMGAYIQDVLDLIEWANGDASTTWGAKRAAAGHPAPFGLKMIGIGNEDMITEVFEVRYKMLIDAVRAKYPDIEVVGTVGPFYEGSDYEEGWRIANEWQIPCVDEHYYVSPGWMIYNQDYYDNYKRGDKATKVYLGEYAAHLPGRPSNMETALAEALYLTSVEKNADVVEMTSYAPLLSKDGHTQWRPDLIYFSNTDVRPTTDYYVQRYFGTHGGDQYIPAEATLSTDDAKARARVGSSIVYNSAEGCYYVKLVNLLPKSVDADIDLSGLNVDKQAEAVIEGMVGNPADTEGAQFSMTAPVSGRLACVMPPYSFTIIKVKGL